MMIETMVKDQICIAAGIVAIARNGLHDSCNHKRSLRSDKTLHVVGTLMTSAIPRIRTTFSLEKTATHTASFHDCPGQGTHQN